MGSRYEMEVTVCSATNLKNVNWRNGELRPYAVVWVDDGPKCSTRVDLDNPGENPVWDDKLAVPISPATTRLEDAVLHIDVVHAANAAEEAEGVSVKPLVGSVRLPLRDVLDDAGVGGAKVSRTLTLKRPSGRPQGRIDLRVAVRESAAAARYYPSPYPAPAAYGAAGSRDPYYAGQPGPGYGQAPPPYAAYGGYGAAAAAGGAPPAYGAAPPPPAYGADPAAAYGATAAAPAPQKSKMGMGAGLAVGAAAGVLGGLALAEGASYLEDKFEDHVADKVEEDLYDDDY